MKITLVVDNPNSWTISYVEKLFRLLKKKRHFIRLVKKHQYIKKGDLAFFIGCEKIVKPEILKLNEKNLVVHESKLPHGRGWSPLSWQIVSGKNEIPIILFEADKKVDSGDIYFQEVIKFNGDELVSELRKKQGEKTIDLVLKFIEGYPKIKSHKQRGRTSYYTKRTPTKDSELDINKSIKSQFNLLRVVDNKRYPAFFKYKNNTYILKIYKK